MDSKEREKTIVYNERSSPANEENPTAMKEYKEET
jgi:hypothetical protein